MAIYAARLSVSTAVLDGVQPPTEFPRAAPLPARGFTLLEMLVAATAIVVLTSLVLVALGRSRQSGAAASCYANLRSIGIALQSYATDSGGYLPYTQGSPQWEHLMLSYITRKTFACPADDELYPSLGSSYDWRDLGDPAITPTSLAGRHLATVSRLDLALAFEALPGWHRPNYTIVVLVDNSVVSMDQNCLVNNLLLPVHK